MESEVVMQPVGVDETTCVVLGSLWRISPLGSTGCGLSSVGDYDVHAQATTASLFLCDGVGDPSCICIDPESIHLSLLY